MLRLPVCLCLLMALHATWAFVPTLPGSLGRGSVSVSMAKQSQPPSKWGKPATPGNKGKETIPDWKKNRARPLDYRGVELEKEQRVIVPATEYFANKNDPIVPTLFASLFIPVFAILGWWLFSPAPEVGDSAPVTNTKTSYDSYFKETNAGYRARTNKGM